MNWLDFLLIVVGSAAAGVLCFVQLLKWLGTLASPDGFGQAERFFITLISVILLIGATVPYALVFKHLVLDAM
jgi:hypothetical protein